MTTTTKRLFAAVALVAVPLALAERPARASGFLIYDMSGEAIGRASAVSADINEPAAVFFNPAAMANMKGTAASAGGVFLTAQSSFEPAGGGAETQSERGNFFLPQLFATSRINEHIAVGVGAFTAFGIGIRWPGDWVGRESNIAASLETVNFNPTVAGRINDKFSAAVGFQAVRGVVDFTTGLPPIVGTDVRVAGGAWGFGANLGVLYRPRPEKLHFAFTYRSRVNLAANSARADFTVNPTFASNFPDQGASAEITLPDIFTFGGMYRPRPNLSLTLDFNYVLWSTFDRVDIVFDVPGTPTRTLEPDGHDTFTLRGGVDWALGAVPGLNIRGGLIFDRAAVRGTGLGPALPDADRIDFALGVGYRWRWLKADLGYLLVYFLPADSVGGREGPVGTYNTIANLLGLTLAAYLPTWP